MSNICLTEKANSKIKTFKSSEKNNNISHNSSIPIIP